MTELDTKTQQVVTFTARGRAELLSAPAEDAGEGEVAGRTIASLISPGTEIGGAYLGDTFPAEPGYTAVFTIDQVGAGVEDFVVGDVVFCSGPGGIGGHRSWQCCPGLAAMKLPDGLGPATALHARLMGVSMSTLTDTAARPGERILILGLGPIGHLAAQLFSACGYRVTAVDPDPKRCELMRGKGVGGVLNEPPTHAAVKDDPYALAIDCSGFESAVVSACDAVRPGGEVVLIGAPWRAKDDVQAHELIRRVYRRHLRLIGGSEWRIPRHPEPFRHGSVFGNFASALGWLHDGRVDVDGLYETAKPSDAPVVYDRLANRNTDALSVVFDWT